MSPGFDDDEAMDRSYKVKLILTLSGILIVSFVLISVLNYKGSRKAIRRCTYRKTKVATGRRYSMLPNAGLTSMMRRNMEVDPKQTRNYQTIRFLSLIALGGHALILVFMLAINEPWLALFNVGSCALYFGCYHLNKHYWHRIAMILATAEIVAHSWLAVTILGWQTGFHLYILCLVPLLILFEGPKTWAKITGIGMLYLSLVSLAHLSGVDPILTSALNYLITFVVLASLAYFYGRAVRIAEESLTIANEDLDRRSRTDVLTELPNRRDVLERAADEICRTERGDSPFCVALADLDDFKMINDRFGHEAGDKLLIHIAGILQAKVRRYDAVARWGGEEFLFIFPESDLQEGISAAENIKSAISCSRFSFENHDLHITATIGVACFAKGSDLNACIKDADAAMYRGKKNGKNRVEWPEGQKKPAKSSSPPA